MDEDIANFALQELLKEASYAEVRLEDTQHTNFTLKNSALQGVDSSRVNGLGMRFINKGIMGFVSTNNLSRDNVREIIKQSMLTVQRGQKIAEKINLSQEKAHVDKFAAIQKQKVQDVSTEDKLRILKEADKALPKETTPARYLSMTDSLTKEHLLTSEGTKITQIIPKVNFFYYLTLKHENKLAQRYWDYGAVGGYEHFKKWNLPGILEQESTSMQNVMKNGIKAPTGPVDVVVAPQVTGIMVHESCGHPLEADRIFGREAAQAGESFIKADMVGKRIGSEHVTIVDDPTVEHGYGFFKYDNEGVKARKKILYENGLVKEFLHNRETAAHMNLPSNGSSRATDYDKESIVRMSNTYLLQGKFTEEELVKSVKKGVFIKNFNEWNIDDIRYNQKYVGANAYMIENGEITTPVLNPTIEITTPKLWGSVNGVAKNFELHAGNCGKGEPMQAIPVLFGGPSMRLSNIRLSQ
ncbi:MAG: TldD/PmbA family protein [Candidatus Woesearchaeota archaeon]